MPVLLRSVSLPLDFSTSSLESIARRAMGVDAAEIREVRLHKRSVDARGRSPKFIVQIAVFLKDGEPAERAAADRLNASGQDAVYDSLKPLPRPEPGVESLGGPVVVIGAGPAGLQAALRLAESGYRPIILERGKGLKERATDVANFRNQGALDEDSTVLFGLGGAGLYSDGKLGTRKHTPQIREVFRTWAEISGLPEIETETRAHIGTDRLHRLLQRFVAKIEGLGGEFRFSHRVESLEIEAAERPRGTGGSGRIGRVKTLIVNGQRMNVGAVVVAPGSSARDFLIELHRAGVRLLARDTLVGLRIELPQVQVDRAVYGRAAGHPALGSAEYFLKRRERNGVRAAHTFCMCPGGAVLAVATEPGGLSTNGMSDSARDSGFANSAILVPVRQSEFLEMARQYGDSNSLDEMNRALRDTDGALEIFSGFMFLRAFEALAFRLGGGEYRMPAMRVRDFLKKRPSRSLPDSPRPHWRTLADLRTALPPEILRSIAYAISDFDRRIPGFSGKNATLYGSEMRSGAVVQIVRDERGVSETVDGLYPAGEGAGYAGGITSSAADGLLAADRIIARFAPP